MIDTDEFMFPLDDSTQSTCSIAQYLRTRCQARQTHVIVRWTMFGSNGFTFHPHGALPETHFWSGGDCTSSALHGTNAKNCDAHSGRRLVGSISPAQNLTLHNEVAQRRLTCKWVAFKHKMECSQNAHPSPKNLALDKSSQPAHAEDKIPRLQCMRALNGKIRTKRFAQESRASHLRRSLEVVRRICTLLATALNAATPNSLSMRARA